VQTGRSKQKQNFCFGLSPGFMVGLLVEPEDGGSTFLRNIGKLLSVMFTAVINSKSNNTYIHHNSFFIRQIIKLNFS
jgi:hypothetical protein